MSRLPPELARAASVPRFRLTLTGEALPAHIDPRVAARVDWYVLAVDYDALLIEVERLRAYIARNGRE